MSSLAMANTLAAVLVPLGNAGAVLAIVCALVTAVALARGAAGLAGGGVGVWILGAMLSLCASFAMVWTPVLVSVGALGASFAVGGLGRALLRGVRRSRAARPARTTAAEAARAMVPTEAARSAAPRTPAHSIPARPVTETMRIAS